MVGAGRGEAELWGTSLVGVTRWASVSAVSGQQSGAGFCIVRVRVTARGRGPNPCEQIFRTLVLNST